MIRHQLRQSCRYPAPTCGMAVFMKEACYVRCTCYSQKSLLRQLHHSAREASIKTKETTQIPSFVRCYSKQQFHWLVNGVEVVGPLGMGPKTGLEKYLCKFVSLFGSWQVLLGWQKRGPCHKLGSGLPQTKVRLAHPHLRLKQQLVQVQRRK